MEAGHKCCLSEISQDLGLSGMWVGVIHTWNELFFESTDQLCYFAMVPNLIQGQLTKVLQDKGKITQSGFLGPRSILWGHWLPLFWTSCNPPHGFQSWGGSFTCILTCLRVVNLRVTSGDKPAFSTNRGVHFTSVYTEAHPLGIPYASSRGQATVDC